MQTWKAILSSVMIGAFGAAATAQDAPAKGQPPAGERPGRGGGEGQLRGDRPGGGMGRQQLSPEKAKAAWDVEAKGVAKRLGLNDAQTTALVKAYADARASENAAFDKARKEAQEKAGDGDDNGGGRRPPQVAMEKRDEIQSAERAKFEKALTAGGLSGEQAGKAVASLGTFNRQWDTMADAVNGFGLEAGKQQEALNAVEEYVLAAGKARAAMSGGGDRESAATAMREAREKLTATMKKTLSEEQFGKFEASMGPGGRGQGRPGGGGEDGAPRPRRNREGGDNGGGEGHKPGDKPGGGGK